MQASCLQIYEGLIWWTEITKIQELATTSGADLFRGECLLKSVIFYIYNAIEMRPELKVRASKKSVCNTMWHM